MNFETSSDVKEHLASEMIEEEIIKYMTYVETLHILISGKRIKGKDATITSQKKIHRMYRFPVH